MVHIKHVGDVSYHYHQFILNQKAHAGRYRKWAGTREGKKQDP